MHNRYLQTAIEIAQQAGGLLMEYFGKLEPTQIQSKGYRDLVTEADYQSEKLIVAQLSSHFPEHGILAEELTDKAGNGPYRWFVDPLDGTVNFAHRHPFFSVSLAMAKDGIMQIGVIFAPVLQQLFYAIKDEGAFCQVSASANQRLHVSPVSDIGQALLATGFAHNRMGHYPAIDRAFLQLLASSLDIRRCGAASLDLCYVASGNYDAFWECGLQPHDVAAGSLIVKEAGGKVSDWQGKDQYLWGKQIVASNGEFHDVILSTLAGAANYPG